MRKFELKYDYSLKQYRRDGFGLSYYFVDLYLSSHLDSSIMLAGELSDGELERLLNVFVSRAQKGEDIHFQDSTETSMNQLILDSDSHLCRMEKRLAAKMGEERFETHYEKKCYYLAFIPKGGVDEVHETFHVSKGYAPLTCLKSAYRMGEKLGGEFRILLSDMKTEVDAELLAFALSEN